MRIPALFILAALASAHAQVLVNKWRDSIPTVGVGSAANLILKDEKNRYLVAGVLDGDYGATADIGVALVGENRKLAAQKRFSHGGAEYPRAAIATGQGAYYIVGETSGFMGGNCPSSWTVLPRFDQASSNTCPMIGTFVYQAFVIKLDANLDTLWTRKLDTVYTGNTDAFLDAGGNLKVVYTNGRVDSLCVQTFSPEGALLSKLHLRPLKYEAFQALPLAGGGLFFAGNRYDTLVKEARMWYNRFDGQGNLTWQKEISKTLDGAHLQFIYPKGDTVIAYWTRYPKPYVEGGEEYVEARIQGASVTETVLQGLGAVHPATPRYRTPGGAILFPPDRGYQAIAKVAAVPFQALNKELPAGAGMPSVHFPDAQHLWCAGPNRQYGSQFFYGEMLLDYPPRWADSLGKTLVFDEDDSVKARLGATDEKPEFMSLEMPGDTRYPFAFDTASKVFVWVPGRNYHGDTSFLFVARDSLGQKDTLRLHVTVRSINDPPEFLEFGYRSIYVQVDSGLTRKIEAFDVEHDPLTYRLLLSPPGLVLGDSGKVNWQPSPLQAGFYPLVLEVSDGQAKDTVAYAVWASNVPAASPIYSVSVGRDPITLAFPDQGTQVIIRKLGPGDSVVKLQVSAYGNELSIQLEPGGDTATVLEVEYFNGLLNAKTKAWMYEDPWPSVFRSGGPSLVFQTGPLGRQGKLFRVSHNPYDGLPVAAVLRRDMKHIIIPNRLWERDMLGRKRPMRQHWGVFPGSEKTRLR